MNLKKKRFYVYSVLIQRDSRANFNNSNVNINSMIWKEQRNFNLKINALNRSVVPPIETKAHIYSHRFERFVSESHLKSMRRWEIQMNDVRSPKEIINFSHN